MKIKKLDARAFSHDLFLVAFVVMFSVIGVGYLVISHADSCTQSVSGATSSPTSAADSSSCTPTSAPVTVATLSGACAITNIPTQFKYQSIVYPTVFYKNTGTVAFAPSGAAAIVSINDNHQELNGKGGPASAPSLAPGQSETVATGLSFQVVRATFKQEIIEFKVFNTSPAFSCSIEHRLPS